MHQERDELIVKETITEEFVVDGETVATETISAEVAVEVPEKAEVKIVLTTGAKHDFAYHTKELVSGLTAKAVEHFARQGKLDPTKSYDLILSGRKLEPRLTLHEAGVKPGDELTLSPCDRPLDGC